MTERMTERMLPAGAIHGVEYWVREEVAADHPGRVYGPSDLISLHAAEDLEADSWHRDGPDYVRTWSLAWDGWTAT